MIFFQRVRFFANTYKLFSNENNFAQDLSKIIERAKARNDVKHELKGIRVKMKPDGTFEESKEFVRPTQKELDKIVEMMD